MKSTMLFLAFMVFSLAVNAGQVTQSDLKVSKIMAGYQGGEIYFFVDKDPVNPKGCGNPKSGYKILIVDPLKSDVSQILSVLLTAKASQSKIEIQVYDSYCLGDHAVVRRVAIY